MPAPMRVLHLPVNVSSLAYTTVRGLREHGIDAHGLVYGNSILPTYNDLQVIPLDKEFSPQWFLGKTSMLYHFMKEISKADLLHWYWGAKALVGRVDLQIVKWMGKPGLVEWLGSDIRIPEVELAENPYYKAIFNNGYEYSREEGLAKSRRLQRQFANAGFSSAAQVGMFQYVQKDIFPHTYTLPRRIYLPEFKPAYPDPKKTVPTIVHIPTAPITKGTPKILSIIERLKRRYKFEFHLIQGVPRTKAFEIMSMADIFLDQFVLGDFGMVSIEAMAMGKPVVCYLKPSILKHYGSSLPIVNADQENLEETLVRMIENPNMRYELGKRSRLYAEQNCDMQKIAPTLISIYQEILDKAKRHHA